MNSKLKHSIHKHNLIAAIASISSGFLITLLVCNDIYYGCMGGWDWISFVFVVGFASLLLFVVGLGLLIFKSKLATAFILSSVLLTSSYLMSLYLMEKATVIFYGERQYKELPPESYGEPYKELPPESNEQSNKPSQ